MGSESATYGHPSVANPWRPLMLPDVTTWEELWDEWNADLSLCWKPRYIGGITWDGEPAGDDPMMVGPTCYLARGGSVMVARVLAKDRTVDAVRRGTIIVRGDVITFRVIDHGNGWALVIAEHSQIIGSAWLAYIRVDSVPAELWPGRKE